MLTWKLCNNQEEYWGNCLVKLPLYCALFPKKCQKSTCCREILSSSKELLMWVNNAGYFECCKNNNKVSEEKEHGGVDHSAPSLCFGRTQSRRPFYWPTYLRSVSSRRHTGNRADWPYSSAVNRHLKDIAGSFLTTDF